MLAYVLDRLAKVFFLNIYVKAVQVHPHRRVSNNFDQCQRFAGLAHEAAFKAIERFDGYDYAVVPSILSRLAHVFHTQVELSFLLLLRCPVDATRCSI